MNLWVNIEMLGMHGIYNFTHSWVSIFKFTLSFCILGEFMDIRK